MKNYYTLVGILANGRHQTLVNCAPQPEAINNRLCAVKAPVDTVEPVFKRFIAFESGGFVAQYDYAGRFIEDGAHL